MPRVRLNDNCHGKVLFISDSVKKERKKKASSRMQIVKKIAREPSN